MCDSVCWVICIVMLCTASGTFRILRYTGIFKAHSGLFRHIQHSVQPSHIHNLAIFWALAYLEPEAYLKPCETLTRHIQNPIIGHYSDIFRTLCNAYIHKNLAYSESWNIQNPSIVASRRILRTCRINKNLRISRTLTHLKCDTYSEPSQRFKIEFFAKINKR